MTVTIIVYTYPLAPNTQKVTQFLSLFNIPHKYVELPVTMPRPLLSAIGITYRRTPLLSINSDMYVDNALIIEKLADIARHTDSGLSDATNHVEYDALGQLAYRCATGLIPASEAWLNDEKLLSDRSELMGRPFRVEDLAPIRSTMISQMRSLLGIVQSHFLGGEKKFFLGGETPSTADLHLYWGLNWGLRFHQGARPEISEATHPRIFQWLSDVEGFITPRRQEDRITMEDAYKVLLVPPTHEYAKFVPHKEDNPEGLQRGQMVKVTPADTGRSGVQEGELISLNDEQVCLRNLKGLVMHFPRFGYEIIAAEGEEFVLQKAAGAS